MIRNTVGISCVVLVAHNGFAFDFLFLVAEVKQRPSLSFFDGINIYFADTLYEARRVFNNVVLFIQLCTYFSW